jgi:hypothetical protein
MKEVRNCGRYIKPTVSLPLGGSENVLTSVFTNLSERSRGGNSQLSLF